MLKNKRSIPEVRERMRELAEQHGIAELDALADELIRNPPVKRARARSKHLTPEIAAEIRRYSDENPKLHQRHIAEKFNMNPGRVSEALNNLI